MLSHRVADTRSTWLKLHCKPSWEKTMSTSTIRKVKDGLMICVKFIRILPLDLTSSEKSSLRSPTTIVDQRFTTSRASGTTCTTCDIPSLSLIAIKKSATLERFWTVKDTTVTFELTNIEQRGIRSSDKICVNLTTSSKKNRPSTRSNLRE